MTRITIDLPDDLAAELQERAASEHRAVEAVAADCVEASLRAVTSESAILNEVRRRQADGLVGRDVDDVFNRLDQKHGIRTTDA